MLQSLKHLRGLGGVGGVEGVQAGELALLFFVGAAGEFELLRHRVAMRIAEGVDADDRQLAGVLTHLVAHGLVLDFAALIAGFHGPKHAAALGNFFKLCQHRFFHQFGELFDDEAALRGVLVFRQAPFAVDDELNRHRTAHAVFGGRGDGLVERVGMQAVAVVVDGDQRLERGADVVELHLLRVQAAPASLDVVFQLLATLIRSVFLFHRHGPNTPRHPAHHGVFRVHAVAEEKAQVRRKVIDVHATRQIGFHKRETVGQRERQLADRVGAGLGNVVAADGHAVKVAHLVVDKILRHIAHDFERKLGRKNAGVLTLVFFQDVGLHRAAHVLQHPGARRIGLLRGGFAAQFAAQRFHLLVDRGVHEHGQNRGRGAIDRHAHTGGGAAQIKAAVQNLHVIQRGDAHARVAYLTVDVGPRVRVIAVERDRIKSGGQALGRHAVAEQLEAGVGAKRVTFARKHARGVFVLAFERKRSRRVGVVTRQVIEHQPLQDVALVVVDGQADFADFRTTQRCGGQRRADFFVPHGDHEFGAAVGFAQSRPSGQQLACSAVLLLFALGGQVACSLGGTRFAGFAHFQHVGSGLQLLDLPRQLRLGTGAGFVATHRVADFGQIAGARSR